MTQTARTAAVRAAVVIAVVGGTSHANAAESRAVVAGQASPIASHAHVRGANGRVVTIISEAAAQSETFRRLVDQIGATDGIVYVAEGHCWHGVRACLLMTMTMMGEHRVLRILVDPRKGDQEFMGSVGHELQHAVEVLTNPDVRSNTRMVLLFYKPGSDFTGRFETDAATTAGVAVRAELRASAAAGLRK